MAKNKVTAKPSFGKKNESKVENGVFIYSNNMTLDQLCKKTGISPSATIKDFLLKGKMISLNSMLDDELIAEVCINNNLDFKKEDTNNSSNIMDIKVYDKETDTVTRSPVVTIMGHVDHGKTTLIDCIRHSSITESEHGGITQEIGAYQKVVNGKKITFIDTPGHEAFTEMRKRGASITDIVVLVVAADDGVKPQTKEAIAHAKAAGVPLVVAINKIDKPGISIDKIKQQLSTCDVLAEDWGGDVMMFPISAKKNEGVNKLLEGILDLAELLDLRANPDRNAIGSVIEATLDKKEGAKATLLVQNGTLKVGQALAVGPYYCKVRRMTNEFNQVITTALPSTPVSITGLSGVPTAGDRFVAYNNDKDAKDAAEKRAQSILNSKSVPTSLLSISQSNQSGTNNSIKLVIKADTQGSTEALKSSLEKIIVEGAKLQVIQSSTGDVTLGDVVLASASNAIIIAFNVKTSPSIKEQAKSQNVEIRNYNVIYNLIEDIELALKGTLAPVYHEVVYGRAEVKTLFSASKVGQIAGCVVTDGKLISGSKVRIFRDSQLQVTTHLTSLKRFKDSVKEVTSGFDCGLTIDEKFNIAEGDIIESFGMEEVTNG